MKPDRLTDLLRRGQDFDKELRDMPERAGARSPDPWPAFADRVGEWLAECVAHGRFLATGTADRRALQGQVDRWTTRLRHADLPRNDIELLLDFDELAGEPLDENAFPYFGLDAVTAQMRFFSGTDTPRFLGRDDVSTAYAEHLLVPHHRALLIESESGGGKSSVAMAGVIPKLQQSEVGVQWLYAQMTPGAQPLLALHQALKKTFTRTPGLPADGSLPTPAELASLLGERQLLLFVDQLEELMTVCVDAQAQQQFCQWLAELAEAGRLRLLATMRSDHHDRLANSTACRGLYRLLTDNDSAKLLPPLSFEQLRQVILRPAQVRGLRFVPASLVDRLANETANLPGGLPRLQFALKRLWALRPPCEAKPGEPRDAVPGRPRLDLIDKEAFRLLPSVSEALGHVAKDLLADLDDGQKKAVERLMLELTVLDERSEAPLRRRRLQAELLAVLQRAGLAMPEQADKLIARFVVAGLLVCTGEGEARQVEVAHESLFRHWDDFQGWIKTDQARGRLRQVRKIAQDALEWEARGRHPDYLRLTGEPLDQALAFGSEAWLDDASQRYCAACEAARRKRHIFNRAAAGFGALLMAALLAGGATALKRHSEGQQTERKLLAANTQLATLLGQLEPLDALDLAYTLERRSPGNFVAPLAHAVDRLEGSSLLGQPDQGTDFTASGRALLQIVRGAAGQLERVDVWPIGDDGRTWKQSLPLVQPANPQDSQAERLASVDVGPPLEAPPDGLRTALAGGAASSSGAPTDRRLVVMAYLRPSPDGQGPSVYTRVLLHAIDNRGAIDSGRPLGEHRFAPDEQPHELSEAAFDPAAGTVTLAGLRYPSDRGQAPKSRLLVLQSDGSAVPQAGVTEGLMAVSAVAGSGGRRVTGQLDGRVACPSKSFPGIDTTPVAALRVAWPWWVALHRSGRLALGNCEQPDHALQMVHDSSARSSNPQSLALVSEPNGQVLSYMVGRRLCQLNWASGSWPDARKQEPCTASGVEADQAMLVFGAGAGGRVTHLALPDRQRPWLVRLGGVPLGPVREGVPTSAEGLPVGQPPDPRLLRSANGPVAGLPAATGKDARAGIRSTDKDTTLWRSVRGGLEEDLTPPRDASRSYQPQAIVVNARGTAAVLDSNGVLVVLPTGKQPQKPVPARFKVECLALSPGGQRLLGSGSRGDHVQVLIDDSSRPPVSPPDSDRKGALLEACAVADNGLAVSGFQDGLIELTLPPSDPEAAASAHVGAQARLLLNPLVQHAFKGGIQSLSVDTGGRFVAALGKPGARGCGGAGEGQQLRIWDRRQASQMPVASTCLPGRQLVAIGPLRQVDAAWQLDLFSAAATAAGGAAAQATVYTCLACGPGQFELDKPASSALAGKVRHFNPRQLGDDVLKQRYGIEL